MFGIKKNVKSLENEQVNVFEDSDLEEKNIEVNVEEISTNDLLNEIIDYFTTTKPKEIGLIRRGLKSIDDIQIDIERQLKIKKINKDKIKDVQESFKKYIYGYYILDELINDDDDVSDIKIVAPDRIRIKRLGKRETAKVKFGSKDEVNRFIKMTAIKNEINISDINAAVTFTDKKSSSKFILRFDIETDYITSSGHHYMHIRKIPKQKYSIGDLKRLGFATGEDIDILIDSIKKMGKILICGKGGSGKTTLFNTLLENIPDEMSALVIQENEELFAERHPETQFLRVRTARGEGKIEYDLNILSAQIGLLADIDLFGIGEIKGAEAKYWFNAAYTGHACITSIHSDGVAEAPDKLVDYIKYATDYKRVDILKMIKRMNLKVVFIEKFKIQEIAAVSDFDYEKEELILDSLYRRNEGR